MRDEGRRSEIQVMNVGEKDLFLRHVEFMGKKAKRVTTAKNEEAASRPLEGEEVFSEETAAPTGRHVEEPNREES